MNQGDHGAGMSLNRVAISATLHCLAVCSIGEVLGMVIGGALHWGSLRTVVVSVVLAFIFGYSLTLLPLLKAVRTGTAFKLALASDTLSITIMEIVDNLIILLIPGAMEAHPTSALFWISMAVSLVLAGVAAFPPNRWLISRGKGHAVVHKHAHAHSGSEVEHRDTGHGEHTEHSSHHHH